MMVMIGNNNTSCVVVGSIHLRGTDKNMLFTIPPKRGLLIEFVLFLISSNPILGPLKFFKKST